MNGGTTFHFVTDGICRALERAFDAAKAKDVRLGGGVSTVREYLNARLIDEMHLAYTPVLLGSGESLLLNLDVNALGYEIRSYTTTSACMHVQIARKSQ